jgi:hypothetical protein
MTKLVNNMPQTDSENEMKSARVVSAMAQRTRASSTKHTQNQPYCTRHTRLKIASKRYNRYRWWMAYASYFGKAALLASKMKALQFKKVRPKNLLLLFPEK